MFHLESAYSRIPRENKKEVKTASFSPPGVVGCCLTMPLGGSAGLPCQAGLRPHSRLFIQFVRRLTTKELVFVRFVALQNARVNDKKVNESMRKNAPTPHFIRVRKWLGSASSLRKLRVAQEKCR